MAKIRIQSEALRQDAQNLYAQIQRLEEEQIKLINLIGKIAASWEGAAAEALIKKIENQIKMSKKAIDLLKMYQKYVLDAAKRFEESDQKAANRINNSF